MSETNANVPAKDVESGSGGGPRPASSSPGTNLAPAAAVPAPPSQRATTPTPVNNSRFSRPTMAPRHGQGLDFTPIITHYLFLATFVLAAIGWLVAFIGQAAFEASIRKSTVVGGIGMLRLWWGL
ncbi:hypothetical protein M408DRAFT_145742 [Serendipita vermifera MAFF 305830]|uniref:Uncharacterized protein n=1 Tax=Serendipita vermifera MAFF 305830 TaxID=933852 RepID=A0A0C2WRN8_SERVB|nr:hypothetical protein M408DRAFT_145742 [Serendipita vermifera MAFF 305830]